jgi:hypothetical protein
MYVDNCERINLYCVSQKNSGVVGSRKLVMEGASAAKRTIDDVLV